MTGAATTHPAWRLRWLDRYAIFFVLLAIYLAGLAISPAFADPNYLFNIVRQLTPGNLPLAILAACCASFLIGALNGVLIAFSRVSPFILTLGMGVTVVGLTQLYTGGTAKGIVSPGFREFFNFRLAGAVPVLTLALMVLVGVGLIIEKTTVFGRRIFLIGSNRRSAILSGLPVRAVTVGAYALSGLFGAFAGIALLARSGVSSTTAGQGLEFQVLAAVVLGGTTFEGGRGGIAGTLAGVLVLVIAFNLVNIGGLPYHMQLVVMGIIIILA